VRCGDGILDAGEACDDGLRNSDEAADACRLRCRAASCGDGAVDSNEACDAGALNSDSASDRCRTTCHVPSCGDGVVDTAEECDDGPQNSDTTPDACRTRCVRSYCGDGVPDVLEGCDWGDANSDTMPDACRTGCQPPACGDGVADTNEACDAAGDNEDCDADCTPALCGDGYVNPSHEECDDRGESRTCDLDCTRQSCGDGTVNATARERCDEGTANSNQRADACRTSCRPASCGDRVVDSGEACDKGLANALAPDACRPDCSLPRCGDGIHDAASGEECDAAELNSDTVPDACRTTCRAAGCGDGVLDRREQCDLGSVNSDTQPNRCRTSCREAYCGDGTLDDGETCDTPVLDANNLRCAGDCSGFTPCGNGILEVGEICDDGGVADDDSCASTCRLRVDYIALPYEIPSNSGFLAANARYFVVGMGTGRIFTVRRADGVITVREIPPQVGLSHVAIDENDTLAFATTNIVAGLNPGVNLSVGPVEQPTLPVITMARTAHPTALTALKGGGFILATAEYTDDTWGPDHYVITIRTLTPAGSVIDSVSLAPSQTTNHLKADYSSAGGFCLFSSTGGEMTPTTALSYTSRMQKVWDLTFPRQRAWDCSRYDGLVALSGSEDFAAEVDVRDASGQLLHHIDGVLACDPDSDRCVTNMRTIALVARDRLLYTDVVWFEELRVNDLNLSTGAKARVALPSFYAGTSFEYAGPGQVARVGFGQLPRYMPTIAVISWL
jgi:cysteine-rich repeat protein